MADRCLLYYITDRSQFRGDESARRRALLAKVCDAAGAGVDFGAGGDQDQGDDGKGHEQSLFEPPIQARLPEHHRRIRSHCAPLP